MTEKQDGLSPMEEIFLHEHIPPLGDNMMEAYDRNFMAEMVKMNIRWDEVPNDTDIEGWRHYDRTGYFRYDRTVKAKPSRTSVEVRVTDVKVQYGEGEEFGIQVYEPQGESEGTRPALLMYHGGGWSHSDSSNDKDLSIFFASDLRAVVFGVDYRLAPEHDIRTIHEDSYQAIEWVIQNAATYRVDTSRLALWGSSAGGHLVAGVAMRDAREHNPSRLVQVNLQVPALCHPEAFDGVLKETLELKWKSMASYFKLGEDPLKPLKDIYNLMTPPSLGASHPLVSPLLHPDPLPAHHAPTHITVGGCDFVRDEGIAYALRLRDSDIDMTLEVVPGVPHGFVWNSKSKATIQWARNQVRVLNRAFKKE